MTSPQAADSNMSGSEMINTAPDQPELIVLPTIEEERAKRAAAKAVFDTDFEWRRSVMQPDFRERRIVEIGRFIRRVTRLEYPS